MTEDDAPLDVESLPEAHQIVLALLYDLDEGSGVSWERLRVAAAEKGIGAGELREVLGAGPDERGA